MGQNYSTNESINYGVYIGDKKENETRVIRHPLIGNKKLPNEPYPSVNTLWSAFEYSFNNFPNKNFLGSRKYDNENKLSDYQWITYSEGKKIISNFASGLISLDLIKEKEFPHKENNLTQYRSVQDKFKFFGIYSKNCEEWVIADFACHLIGATVVTFYDTLGDSTISYILNQTKLNTLLMEIENLPKILKLADSSNSLGELNTIILITKKKLNKEENELIERSKKLDLNILLYSDIIDRGKENIHSFTPTPSKPDTIATICYTSGTTGTPKGAMLSNSAIIADTAAMIYSDAKLTENDIHLSYLPLAHVFERVFMTAILIKSGAVGFYQGSPLKVTEDAQILKPTVFIGVPRVFQRVTEKIKEKINNSNFISRNLALKAIRDKTYYCEKYGILTHSVYDNLVFKKMKSALGGNVRLFGSGSAPLSKEIQTFMKICFSCPLIQGYGATENCAAATFISPFELETESVGGVICSIEMKLIDVPEMKYFTNNSKNTNNNGSFLPKGEILLRGPPLFSGYFQDTDNTNNSVDKEGWLHTGDIGIINPNMSLKIIDRRKNIFKLSIGEYIAPEKIENILVNNDYISQVYIYGDSMESSIVALIIPNFSCSISKIKTLNINLKEKIEFNIEELVETDFTRLNKIYNTNTFKEFILKEIDNYSRTHGLKGFEIVKNSFILAEPFSVENGLLTPSMKIKRQDVKEKYIKEFNELYNQLRLIQNKN